MHDRGSSRCVWDVCDRGRPAFRAVVARLAGALDPPVYWNWAATRSDGHCTTVWLWTGSVGPSRWYREHALDHYRGCMGDFVAWALELASEKLGGVLPRRWAHVQGVARRARVVTPLFSVDDCELLVGAALLHDIGYAPELINTGFHPLDGARYLRGVGGPDRLANLVAHHSCATLEAELRGLSDELAEFEDERTALRDALWWADMTTTPDGSETTAVERVAEIQTRYGPDDLISCFIRQAWGDLNAAAERTQRRLEAAGISHA